MKILGICGSPKKDGSTTEYALKKALNVCEEQGLESELITLSEYSISGCDDCRTCKEELTCSIDDDFTNTLLPKLQDDDIKGFIFGSPVYIAGMTSQLKAFFDRCVSFRRNGFKFEDKVAAALTVGGTRNGGQELVAMDIVKSCFIQGMITIPDSSPTSHFGANLWSKHPGGIENDEHGLKTAANTGSKIARVIKKLE